jgi:hypothetical protein
MPILSYFAVVGSVLVALLFVADARLDKQPLPYSSEYVALPKAQPQLKSSILTATPAPAPDMFSAAVLAAAPPPPSSAELAAAALAKAEAVPQRTVKAETAPKKPKRVVRRAIPRDDGQNYAWRSANNGGFFGGGNSMFGRF